jgi:Co/Zn/Cd efflux system component
MQQKSIEAAKKLLLVTAISVVFMLVELVGGVMSNSIAILTDAAH